MPELPDVVVYLERLEELLVGRHLAELRVANPFLVRSVAPHPADAAGRRLVGLRRLGKRLVFEWERDPGERAPLFWILHLMIAGRLKLAKQRAAPLPARIGLAAFDFEHLTVFLTEAGKKRRASLYAAQGEAALLAFDPGGVEPLEVDLAGFTAALTRNNHTLKRALTDPRILSGIGNAYSDEILWEARLSPVTWTSRLTSDELARLFNATVTTLNRWADTLRAEAGATLPEKVTAFREDMAVHGRYGLACPRCAGRVMRIRYADNETNYCPECQTGGRPLADRGLSRLLGKDWPRTMEELEERLRA
jgi:formamidopyrimidine-DNA glycosylase